jgi:tetratricopeptide (TPR) repeat protein
MALVAQGKVDEALVEIDRESEPIYRALTRPIVLNALGRSAEAEQALAETVTKYGEGFPYSIGIIYAERRDLTRAFEWWQKAIQNHDPDAAYFAKSIPNFVQMPKIAGDVRYKAMLRKLNLPE